MGKKEGMLAEITLILSGIFLIFDSIFVHAITFDYSTYNITWLDPFISHAFIGVGLIMIALVDMKVIK